MIRILIVDDELIVRVGIKSMIDWNSHGYQIVGEAADGEAALEMIPALEPHIVLTDIKMPKIDGIELIKNIKGKYEFIKIVVLSCHNDFDYVKQAMKLGASDYILKLSMRREELLDVMNGLKGQIEESKRHMSEVGLLHRKINANMDAIKEKFFRKVINGTCLQTQDLYHEAKDLNIRFCDGGYIVSVTQINKWADTGKKVKLESDLLRYSILNIMEEIISKDPIGDVFADSNDRFVTIYTIKKNTGDFSSIKEKIRQLVSHIHDSLQIYLNVNVSTGICGRTVSGINRIYEAYNEALEASEHRFYFNDNKIIFFGEFNYTGEIFKYFHTSMQKKIYKYLQLGEIDEASSEIGKIFDLLMETMNISPNEIRRMSKQIINVFSQIIGELNISDDMGRPIDFDLKNREIDNSENIFMLKKWFGECIIEYTGYYHKILKGAYTEEILKLKQHISENYYKNISLEQAAGFLNVDRNYFCNIFKKETGETFTDYLVNVRMEKARKLLKNTSMKNYEIATEVGYDNFNYFSTVFKKVTGVSPNVYRKGL